MTFSDYLATFSLIFAFFALFMATKGFISQLRKTRENL